MKLKLSENSVRAAVIGFLQSHPGRYTPGELATRFHVTRNWITSILRELRRYGWTVERDEELYEVHPPTGEKENDA
jgi:hypothetical protein